MIDSKNPNKLIVPILCYADNYTEIEKERKALEDMGMTIDEDEYDTKTWVPKTGVIMKDKIIGYHTAYKPRYTTVYLAYTNIIVCISFDEFHKLMD